MGTDIHAFVEYANTPNGEGFRGDPACPARLLAEFFIDRDYDLFEALANARTGLGGQEQITKQALFPPRGIPADLSYETAIRYFDLIEDPTSGNDSNFWPRTGRVSRYEARGRVDSGDAHYGTVLSPLGKRRLCQTVSKLGWHTPSWLLTSEVEAAIGHHGLAGSFRFDLRLLMQTMKTIEAELESERVRLVFWFDS